MSIPSGVTITDECLDAFRALHSGRGRNKLQYVIFKIADDEASVVVEDSSSEHDYETFRQKLSSAVDSNGRPLPRYGVYDVEYDLGEDGKRAKTVFFTWVPQNTPLKLCMLYASTNEQLKNALNLKIFIHADSPDELEWKSVLSQASGGRV
ncbi:cofilin, actophorin [Aspergillus steynii IBT 23096]|uniref:Cofilin n=1 Tax=Aspergillus steynii IBT 23096 TaxID=1392250 RepID=A0A2I2GL17_9EURO|nr:cofilin, actophorin [Aspergillus steynii IBT 23096]PLB53568.1 cofilin, actophorin [Aspergillus steynii IBT 23096]